MPWIHLLLAGLFEIGFAMDKIIFAFIVISIIDCTDFAGSWSTMRSMHRQQM